MTLVQSYRKGKSILSLVCSSIMCLLYFIFQGLLIAIYLVFNCLVGLIILLFGATVGLVMAKIEQGISKLDEKIFKNS